MTLRKVLDTRLGRAMPKEKARRLTLHELLKDLPEAPVVRAERARREKEAEDRAKQAARPADPRATGTPKNPPLVRAAAPGPTPEAAPVPSPAPPWFEELLGSRRRGLPELHAAADTEHYETLHRYDPIEWLLNEEND